MEHVPDRSTLRGNVVYTDHYVSTFLRWRYFLRRYSFPYDESKGIDARNIMGRRGEKPRCFYTHYRITLRISASYQDLNILITSNLVDFPLFFFFFFAPPIPEIFSSGMRGKNIFLARISLHARPIKKQDAYFLGRTVHFPDVLDVDPTLRKSVNHPRGKLARASGDRRGWTRDTRLTVAEEPSRVCGGNEGVDISARAP